MAKKNAVGVAPTTNTPPSGGTGATMGPGAAAAPRVETKPTSPVVGQTAKAVVTHEQIAQAAYLRWQKNGGSAEENWRAAERELMGA